MQDIDYGFIKDFAAIVEADVSELSHDYRLDDNNWDSVAVISGIALIDGHFHVTVPAAALRCCHSVGAVLELIETVRASGR